MALGLPRTGTLSMATALSILGYQNVYHYLLDEVPSHSLSGFIRAAEASFPSMPGYTGEPLTREQWDHIFGRCEAVTELAGLFGPELVRVYPHAKVVLVKRDFESWRKSFFDGLVPELWSPLSQFFVHVVNPLNGDKLTLGIRGVLAGFFGTDNLAEWRGDARAIYERHYREIQEIVPPDQLLMYNLSDGWEPLCRFLGKPVPDVSFPNLNELAMLKLRIIERQKGQAIQAVFRLLRWTISAGVLGIASWMAAKLNKHKIIFVHLKSWEKVPLSGNRTSPLQPYSGRACHLYQFAYPLDITFNLLSSACITASVFLFFALCLSLLSEWSRATASRRQTHEDFEVVLTSTC